MKALFSSTSARRLDPVVLGATVLLIAAGLLSIFSATHNAALIVKFQKQVFWTILGLLSVGLILLAPARFFHYSAWMLYGVSLFLLLLVLFFGKTVSGNAGWFGIGGFGIQPSEFAKVTTILALARFSRTAPPACAHCSIWRNRWASCSRPGY